MKNKLNGFKSNYRITTEITNTVGDYCVVKATVSAGSAMSSTLITRVAHSSGLVEKIETIEESAINRALSFFLEDK